MYKGIGFSKKVNDCFEIPRNAKKYLMQKEYNNKRKSNDIINYIDPIYLEIASEIIKLINLISLINGLDGIILSSIRLIAKYI